MTKKVIETNHAPLPIGPYSQAILSENTLYVSGQLPLDPESNFLIDSDVSLATKQVLDNIGAILQKAEMNFSHVCMATIFVTDISKFAEVNAVYSQYFESPYPARQTIQVAALPMGAPVEISVVAYKHAE